MVQALGCVCQAFISSGSGYLDFEPKLWALWPSLFIVNEDGNTPAKRKLCKELGVEYIVLRRDPHAGPPVRSTTSMVRSQMTNFV